MAMSPASAAMRASASRAKTSTWASSLRRASSRIATRRSSAPETRSAASMRGQQALAERGLFSAAGGAVPRGRRFECRPRSRDLSERTQDAPEMDPGERRQAYITGGFGLVDRELQGGRTGVVVTGLALRSSETGELVRLRLQEAETSRRLRGATDVEDGVVEPVLDAGQLAEHRVAANVQPRVVDRSQPVLDVIASLDAALLVTGGDRGSGGEQPVRGLIPRPVQPVVERATAIGQLHRLAELAVMRHDVGEVVASSAPAGRRRRSRRPARWLRRCGRGRVRGDPSTLRSTPRAAGRWPGPGPAPRRRPRRVRPRSVARLCCRRGRPRPNRTR